MLVLSRREAEKVLFPKLGITIEVTRIQGRTVRLGIDAPDEIRIIRAELEDTADLDIDKSLIHSNRRFDRSWDAPTELQKCLDAANLAIHLAQNQLRQQLTGQAEEALEHALECLHNLELAVSCNDSVPTTAEVREAKTGYQRSKKKVALVVNENDQLGSELESRLNPLGYATSQLDSGEALIRFLQRREQPNLVLTFHPPTVEDSVEDSPPPESLLMENNHEDALAGTPDSLSSDPACELAGSSEFSRSGLRVFGVGGLQKSCQAFSIGDYRVVGWFAEPTDAAALANCFD